MCPRFPPCGPSELQAKPLRFLPVTCFLGAQPSGADSGVDSNADILPKEPCALIGDGNPVLALNVQLILRRPQLLLKFVDICHLHPVQQGQPLRKKEGRVRAEPAAGPFPSGKDTVQKDLTSKLKFSFPPVQSEK